MARFPPDCQLHAAYLPGPVFGAGLVSGLGFAVGRDTPMLSNTYPKPFFSASKKLIVQLPFRPSAASQRVRHTPQWGKIPGHPLSHHRAPVSGFSTAR